MVVVVVVEVAVVVVMVVVVQQESFVPRCVSMIFHNRYYCWKKYVSPVLGPPVVSPVDDMRRFQHLLEKRTSPRAESDVSIRTAT